MIYIRRLDLIVNCDDCGTLIGTYLGARQGSGGETASVESCVVARVAI